MEFSMKHVFNHDIAKVWAMFCNPDSHVTKFTAMGHREIEVVEADSSDETLHIVISRVIDMDMPGFAKKVMSPSNTVVTTDDWHRSADGNFVGDQTIDIHGAPVKTKTRTKLVAVGERTEYTIDVDVSVKVPLIGGKISDWLRGMVSKQVEQEFTAGESWLASH